MNYDVARSLAASSAFPDPGGQRTGSVGWWLLPRPEPADRAAPEDLSWLRLAACRGMDPSLFHPEVGNNADSRFAREACRSCSVQDECLDYALANNERLGIWGGLGEKERRRVRRQRSQAAAG